jgi:hypothetical protein
MKNNHNENKGNKLIFSISFLFLFILILFCFGVATIRQDFVILGRAFLEGKMYFPDSYIQITNGHDSAIYNGQYFWPLGPFPTILILPFVFIFEHFYLFFRQEYASFFLTILIAWLIVLIGKKAGYQLKDNLYWCLAFIFGSVFIQVALSPNCWFFAQTVTTALLFWLIYESLNKKRPWLLGIISAFTLATRISAGIGSIIFVVLLNLFIKKKKATFIKQLLFFFLPIIFMLGLLAFYNYARFQNILEFGYNYQIVDGETLYLAKQYGLFSLVHIPGNLYYFLLASPLPVFRDEVSHVLKFPFITNNLWGTSIFITSPYFAYLFLIKYKEKLNKILLISAILTSILVFSYYGIGFTQVGYRYSLDFLPFLFVLLMLGYKEKNLELSTGIKIVILFGIIFDFLLFMTFFNAQK